MVKKAVNQTDKILDLLFSQKVAGEEPSYIKTKSLTVGIVRNQPWNMPYNYASGNGEINVPKTMPIFQTDRSDLTNYLDASVSKLQITCSALMDVVKPMP